MSKLVYRNGCDYPSFCTEDRYDAMPGCSAWPTVEPGDIIPIIGKWLEVVRVGRDNTGRANVHYADGRVDMNQAWSINSTGYGLVLRPRRTSQAPIPVAAVTVAPDPARLWNGTCCRCGKGTYEGAWKMEHEGGPCQALLGVVRR